jgi:hypothetical protein
VIPGSGAALYAAQDEQEQVRRLERFRAAHPDVVILLLGTCPKAWLDGQRIERPTLRGLLDGLEEIFHPGAQASHAEGSR